MTIAEVTQLVDMELRTCGKGSRKRLLDELQWLLDRYYVDYNDDDTIDYLISNGSRS